MLKHYDWLVPLPIVKDDFTAILQNLHALHTFHFFESLMMAANELAVDNGRGA